MQAAAPAAQVEPEGFDVTKVIITEDKLKEWNLSRELLDRIAVALQAGALEKVPDPEDTNMANPGEEEAEVHEATKEATKEGPQAGTPVGKTPAAEQGQGSKRQGEE